MRKKYIIGNWKMNKTNTDATSLINSFKCRLDKIDNVEVVVCPSFIALSKVQEMLSGTDLALGAQNVHYVPAGAYTGEISIDMLVDVGVKYCIVGHSERREYFGETDNLVSKKVEALLEAGITPIICVGESLELRENGDYKAFVETQIRGVLDNINPRYIEKCIIAYEPIWAIGTGKTATSEQAQDMCEFIRYTIQKMFGDIVSNNLPILYGGSVNISNAKEILSMSDIDGALIGGASLKPDFVDIVLTLKK